MLATSLHRIRSWSFVQDITGLKEKKKQQRLKDRVKFQFRILNLCFHERKTHLHGLKNLEQKFIFQIGTLNPHGINERFSFN